MTFTDYQFLRKLAKRCSGGGAVSKLCRHYNHRIVELNVKIVRKSIPSLEVMSHLENISTIMFGGVTDMARIT